MKPRRHNDDSDKFVLVLKLFALILILMTATCSAEINSAIPDAAMVLNGAKSAPSTPPSTSLRAIDRNEGSGNAMDWSDDEDLVGEGSGSGDDEAPIQQIMPVTQRDSIRPSAPQQSTPAVSPRATITDRPSVQIQQRPTKAPSIVTSLTTTTTAKATRTTTKSSSSRNYSSLSSSLILLISTIILSIFISSH